MPELWVLKWEKDVNRSRESVAFKRFQKKKKKKQERKTLGNGLFGIIPRYFYLVNLYIFVDCFQTFYRRYFIRRLYVATDYCQRVYR